MTQRMWVPALGDRGRCDCPRARDVLAEEIARAEARQRMAATAAEQGMRGVGIEPALADQRRQGLGGLRPERTESLLAPLAAEPHLERPRELEVARSHVEDLLYARPRVEHGEQQRVIPAPRWGPRIGGIEEGAHLVHLQVLDDAGACALERDREQPLAPLEVLGLAHRGVPCERVHGREARIA